MIMEGINRRTRSKTYPSATLSTTNPTSTFFGFDYSKRIRRKKTDLKEQGSVHESVGIIKMT